MNYEFYMCSFTLLLRTNISDLEIYSLSFNHADAGNAEDNVEKKRRKKNCILL